VSKSNRRKKQDRAKAEARRAEQARRHARKEQDRAMMEHYARMTNPQAPPEEVAELVALELADSAVAGTIARARLRMRVPADEVARSAELLLATQPSRIGALTFAAALAHHAGDEEEEHRHTAKALALARAGADDAGTRDDAPEWLQVVRFIASDHPGEAVALTEPYVAAEPDDPLAGEIYAAGLERLFQSAEPADSERAALDRFADRSALIALREAFGEFLDRTEWGKLVARRVADKLAEAGGLPPDERETFIELCSEIASVAATPDGHDEERETPLRAFARDPSVPADIASVAAAWNDHAHYGLWQIADPVAAPGVWCTDLVSGRPLYVQFPPEVIAEAPPWTVWLGAVVPVNGIWRCAGTGSRLSPAEADAAAEYIDQAALMVGKSLSGTPDERLPKAHPMRFGLAAPYGLRWEYDDPMPLEYAAIASLVTSELIARVTVDIARYRDAGPAFGTGEDVGGREKTWLDEPVPVLRGRTPRQAAASEGEDFIRLKSLLRQLEYEAGLAAIDGRSGIDVPWLRRELDMPSERGHPLPDIPKTS
jgi:hypothetical protein